MRWMLENPGYEIDDRRQEVTGDLYGGESSYLTNNRTLDTIMPLLFQYGLRNLECTELQTTLEQVKQVQACRGVFWENSAPDSRSSCARDDLAWNLLSIDELCGYSPYDGFEHGRFPVAARQADIALIRRAIQFCLKEIDENEMTIFVRATVNELHSLMELLNASG